MLGTSKEVCRDIKNLVKIRTNISGTLRVHEDLSVFHTFGSDNNAEKALLCVHGIAFSFFLILSIVTRYIKDKNGKPFCFSMTIMFTRSRHKLRNIYVVKR